MSAGRLRGGPDSAPIAAVTFSALTHFRGSHLAWKCSILPRRDRACVAMRRGAVSDGEWAASRIGSGPASPEPALPQPASPQQALAPGAQTSMLGTLDRITQQVRRPALIALAAAG